MRRLSSYWPPLATPSWPGWLAGRPPSDAAAAGSQCGGEAVRAIVARFRGSPEGARGGRRGGRRGHLLHSRVHSCPHASRQSDESLAEQRESWQGGGGCARAGSGGVPSCDAWWAIRDGWGGCLAAPLRRLTVTRRRQCSPPMLATHVCRPPSAIRRPHSAVSRCPRPRWAARLSDRI